MSNAAVTWARQQRVGDPTRKLLFVILADYADEAWTCYPGQKLLAEECEVTTRTIRTHLDALVGQGLLDVEHRYRDGRRTSSRYRLRREVESVQNLPANPSASPAHDVDLPEVHGSPTGSPLPGLPEAHGSTSGSPLPGGTPKNPQSEPPGNRTTPPGAAQAPSEASAQALIGEWIDHCPDRPPARVVGQTAREVRLLLDEGIPVDDVRAGLIEWHRKGLHPSTLASVVHEVRTAEARALLAAPARPSTTDQRVAAGLALAEKYRDLDRLDDPQPIGAIL